MADEDCGSGRWVQNSPTKNNRVNGKCSKFCLCLLFLQYLSHRARLLIFIYLNFYRQSNIKRQQVNCGSGRWGTEQSGFPRTSSFNGSTGAPRQSGAGRRPGGRITGAGRRAGGAERGGGRTPPPRRVRGAVQHVRERQLGRAEDTARLSKSLSIR